MNYMKQTHLEAKTGLRQRPEALERSNKIGKNGNIHETFS